MKGQSEFLSGVLLLSLAILVSATVGFILLNMAKQGTSNVENSTMADLSCFYDEFYTENASFDANSDCTRGVNHTLSITIRNTGDRSAKVGDVIMESDTGTLMYFRIGQNLTAGETRTFNIKSYDSCVGIINQNSVGYVSHIKSIHIGSVLCPSLDTIGTSYIFTQNANQSESQKNKYLMGLWRFNSTLNDSSGNGNNGNYSNGSATYLNGVNEKFGNSLNMSGVIGYVEVPNSPSINISGSMTMEVWINASNYTNATYYYQSNVSPDWWNASWHFRRNITLSSNALDNITNYQIPINMTTFDRNLSSLVGSWHFSESSGNFTLDSSGNGNHAYFRGSALKFDGTDDYVNFTGASITSMSNYNGTIMAWIKTSNAGSVYRGIVVKQSAYGMFLRDNYFGIYDWNATSFRNSTINLADGSWHHVAFSFINGTENNSIAYIDGEPVLLINYTINSQSSGLTIASGNNAGAQNFNGTIDDVRVFNRSLSEDEIIQNYNGNYSNTTGLILYIPFMNASGTNVTDFSGFGNNGTLYNFSNTTAGAGDSSDSGWTIYGRPLWTNNGVEGNSLRFDGFSDYAGTALNRSTTNVSRQTISAWFKSENSTNYQAVFSSEYMPITGGGGQRILVARNMTGVWYNTWNGSSSSSIIYNFSMSKSWYNVIAVLNETNLSMYINGILVNSSSRDGFTVKDIYNYWIGRSPYSGGSYPFNGTIDEVRIFNSSLNESEIIREFCIGAYRLNHTAGQSFAYNSTMCNPIIKSYSYYWQDLRFVNNTNSTMNYWVESDVKAWVNVSSIISNYNTTIFAYYGNPVALSESNTTKTFTREISNLSGAWDFNEGTGATTADNSGNNNTGYSRGSALRFDGTNDYVNLSNSTSLGITNNTSFEFWFRINNVVGANDNILQKNQEYLIRIDNSSEIIRLNTFIYDGTDYETRAATGPLEIDRWYHYIGVINVSETSIQKKIYVNGIINSTEETQTGTISITSKHAYIGSSTSPINGTLDELRMYNRSLTASEILEHYNGIYKNESGLVLYMPFSSGNGNVITDYSGLGNNGTLYNSNTSAGAGDTNDSGWATYGRPLWTNNTVWGSALKFDGVDDIVSIPDSESLNPSSEITYMVWFRANTISVQQGIISKYIGSPTANRSYNLHINNTDPSSLRATVSKDGTTTSGNYTSVFTPSGTISSGIWHHAAVVFKGGEYLKIYVNGIEAGNTTTGVISSLYDNGEPLRIGVDFNLADSTRYFNGTIDDVRIYNRSLLASEISSIYNNNYTNTSGLVLYIPFMNAAGTNATDYSGFGNNGTLYNFSNISARAGDFSNSGWSTNSPIGIGSRFGNAFAFSGIDSYISISNSSVLNPTNEFSVEAWVYGADNITKYQTLINRWNTGSTFNSSSSWMVYNASNTSNMSTKGYVGGAFDGRYVYFVPFQNESTIYHGRVLRYDTRSDFNSSYSWLAYDAGNTSNMSTKGYRSAVFDGRYIYFAPYNNNTNYSGFFLRYDTNGIFNDSSSWLAYNASNTSNVSSKGFSASSFDGRYVYFLRNYNGSNYSAEVTRYDTQGTFNSSSSWLAYDIGEAIGFGEINFFGTVFDGKYMYFTPYRNVSTAYEHGLFLRYDINKTFNSTSSWEYYDASNTSGMITKGYIGGAFDGRYIYFAPLQDNGTSYHGRVLRYDTIGNFTSNSSWIAYDAGNTSNLASKGFAGANFDGRYVYFTPLFNGSLYDGIILRYDTQGNFTSNSSWIAYDANNTSGLNAGGYEGAVFDGRYLYFVPYINGGGYWNGHVLRYDTTGNDSSFSLDYSQLDHSGGFSGGPRGASFRLNIGNSSVNVYAGKMVPETWNHIVGTYNGSDVRIYLNGALAGNTTASGSMNPSTAIVMISKMSNGNGYFNGTIDGIRIFNRALNESEIFYEYNNSGYATWNYPGTELIKKFSIPEPNSIPKIEEWSNYSIPIFVNITQNVRTIIQKGTSYALKISNTTVYGIIGNTNISAAIQNTWQHVAMNFNGSSLMLYVNGQQINSTSSSSPITNNESLFIGGSVYNDTMNGTIDELKIYNISLSQADIYDNYIKGTKT